MADALRLVDVNPAAPSDLAALASLHASAFEKPWRAQDFAALFTPGAWAWLAFQGASAVGLVFVRAVVDEAEVLTLAVAPSARRRGVAQGLLKAAIAALDRQGVIDLWLEVAETNFAALALYQGLGFHPAGRRSGYYSGEGPPVDAVILRLLLNSAPG